MNSSKIAYSALGAAALVLTGIGPASASSPHATATPTAAVAAGSVCQIRVLSTTARHIQEDNQGTDEVFLRLGNVRTVQRTYFEGQLRNVLADGFDVFSGPEPLRLVEHDPGSNDVIDSDVISCTTHSGKSVLKDATKDTVYKVLWTVSVLIP